MIRHRNARRGHPDAPNTTKAGPTRHRWLWAMTTAAIVVVWACNDGGPAAYDDEEAAVAREVLASLADEVIVPAVVEFDAAASELVVAAESWRASPDSVEAQEDVRQAWRVTFRAWQVLEVMQVGPAASTALGGDGVRDRIYSYPTVDTCTVDRVLVDQQYEQPGFFEEQLVLAYGLDALEYLSFAPLDGHTCPEQVQLDDGWNALDAEQILARRAAYAQVVASDIARHASELSAVWSGGYARALGEPGSPSSPFADEREALNALFAAMFYVDKLTKDAKLGVPIGYVDGCAAVPCSEQLEAPHSGQAAVAIEANLQGLRRLVAGAGAGGVGFARMLEIRGQPQIADTLLADIDQALAQAAVYDEPLQAVAERNPEEIGPLFSEVKDVTDTLKGPFLMTLSLAVPREGAGEND